MKKLFKFIWRTFLLLFILLNIIIIFQAYKFTHFYNAGEVSTTPDSLRSGWEKTSDILFGKKFAKRPNNLLADTGYQNITLNTKDDLKLQGWYFTTANAKGAVALFHGHGGNKSGTLAEAAVFRSLGYNTLLLDFRAHGNSDGNTCTIGNYESEDVKLAYEYLQNRGEKNILLWGISMGAACITKAVNDYELKPSKIILEMPFASILQAVKGKVRMMHLPEQPISTLLTFWGGTEHGFWAFGNKPAEFVRKITCPVLLQWGANDPRVSKAEIDELYQNLAVQKTLVVYNESGHESLCKKEAAKWTAAITEFLK